MDHELTQRVPSTLEALERAAGDVRQLLAREGVDAAASYAVDLALEEIGSNIIRHGLVGAADGEIGLWVRVEPRRVVVVFEDEGPPFDPTARPAPALDAPLSERPIGGLGIHLVKEMAASAIYHRSRGRNRLEVIVAREGAAGGAVDSPTRAS